MYLLDTHVFIWAVDQPHRLSATLSDLLQNPWAQLFVSTVTSWEIFTKSAIGKLPEPWRNFEIYEKAMQSFSAHKLMITDHHCFIAAQLPMHHRDPFDRLLIAQAQAEHLTLITNDPAIAQYDVARVW